MGPTYMHLYPQISKSDSSVGKGIRHKILWLHVILTCVSPLPYLAGKELRMTRVFF